MIPFIALLKREFRSWIFSPVGYIVPACYFMLTGWRLVDALRGAEGGYVQLESLVTVNAAWWLPVVVAAVTMRGFARARGDRSLEVLLSAPVSDMQVVMAKFIAAWMLVMLVALGNVVFVGIVLWACNIWPVVDPGCVAGAVIGMGMLVALWCSLGLLISLLTREQGIAGVATLLVVGLPVVMGDGALPLPFTSSYALPFHPVYTHLADMSAGLLSFGSLVIYAGGAAAVLFICVRVLESLRWR